MQSLTLAVLIRTPHSRNQIPFLDTAGLLMHTFLVIISIKRATTGPTDRIFFTDYQKTCFSGLYSARHLAKMTMVKHHGSQRRLNCQEEGLWDLPFFFFCHYTERTSDNQTE